MKARVVVLAAVVVAATAPSAPAQQVDPQCTDPGIVLPGQPGGDACQKVVDLYRYMNVQLGTLLAGGNATLGQGGTLGGLGHFAVEVRANVMQASIPDVETTGIETGPAQQTEFATDDKWVPLPVVDAAVGLFKGIPLGITTVAGVDALVSVAYLPEFHSDGVDVTVPDGSLKWGFGARLGVLQETALIPGVAFTYFRRDLPRVTITAEATPTRTASVRDYDVKTKAWRLVASKHFLVLGLAAGIGQDTYDASADLTYNVDGITPARRLALDVNPKRTNMFLDVSLNFPLLKIVGEVGRVSGGDVATFNTFTTPADAARTYGSLGIRLGI